MISKATTWDSWYATPKEALEAKWNQIRFERQQVELRKKCREIFKAPPSVFVVERGFLSCSRCGFMIQDYGVPANIMTCPNCESRWKIQAYFTPRKSGQPARMTYSSIFRTVSKARLSEGEPDELKPDEKVDYKYFCFERAVFQCPECGHLMFIKKGVRNTFQCTRCKRHWEILVVVESLSLDVPSCENISAEENDGEAEPIESLPESTPGLFAI